MIHHLDNLSHAMHLTCSVGATAYEISLRDDGAVDVIKSYTYYEHDEIDGEHEYPTLRAVVLAHAWADTYGALHVLTLPRRVLENLPAAPDALDDIEPEPKIEPDACIEHDWLESDTVLYFCTHCGAEHRA